jgi:hypothetical protein
MSSIGMTRTVLATGLSEAIAKDNPHNYGQPSPLGNHGPAVQKWLREVAQEFNARSVESCKPGD